MHLLQALEMLEYRGWRVPYPDPNDGIDINRAIDDTWMELHGYTASSETRYVHAAIRELFPGRAPKTWVGIDEDGEDLWRSGDARAFEYHPDTTLEDVKLVLLRAAELAGELPEANKQARRTARAKYERLRKLTEASSSGKVGSPTVYDVYGRASVDLGNKVVAWRKTAQADLGM